MPDTTPPSLSDPLQTDLLLSQTESLQQAHALVQRCSALLHARLEAPESESESALWGHLFGAKESALGALSKLVSMHKLLGERMLALHKMQLEQLKARQQADKTRTPDAFTTLTEADWDIIEHSVQLHRQKQAVRQKRESAQE